MGQHHANYPFSLLVTDLADYRPWQQLDTIQRLTIRAELGSISKPNERYSFDYPHLIQDIQRIHQGVKGYLSLSRAQSGDPSELVGEYRHNTPPAESPP